MNLHEKWLDSRETEESHCLHRFHLFHRLDSGPTKDPNQSLKLIMEWIGLAEQLPAHAFDVFDTSLRLVNWSLVLSKIDHKCLDDSVFEVILSSIKIQATHVRYGIEYETPGNHVLYNLFSLWCIKHMLPLIFREDELAVDPAAEIEKEILTQFGDDGFHVEHSLHYHVQSLLVASIWLKSTLTMGRHIDRRIGKILKSAHDWVRMLHHSDYSLPVLGDKAHSLLFANSVEDVTALSQIWNSIDYRFSAQFRTSVEKSMNYVVLKSGRLKLIVDVGNIGFERNPGHGHSDLLSFIFYSEDISVFVDAGTKSYSECKMETSYKRARVHNTISVDGEDQAKLWGYFRWGFLPSDLQNRTSFEGENTTLEASYHGFRHIGGLTHTRRFILNEHHLIITDLLTGLGRRDVSLSLLVGSGLSVWRNENIVEIEGQGCRVFVTAEARADLDVEPMDIFWDYNSPVKGTLLRYSFEQTELPFRHMFRIDVVK